jgi:hypothetical protein
MSSLKKVGDLQIDQDLKFQKKEWSVERAGWLVMLVIVVLAVFGLFGQGPLSNTTIENESLQVKYGRFERLLAPVQIHVQVDAQQAASGEVKLQVDQGILSHYEVEKIVPEPDSVELAPEQVTYTFKTSPGEQPLEINFYLQANQLGTPNGKIGLVGGPMLDITQLIYP